MGVLGVELELNDKNFEKEQKQAKLKVKQDKLSKELRNSIKIINEKPKEFNSSVTNLKNGKKVIISISQLIDFKQLESNSLTFKAGYVLYKIKTLCKKENKNLIQFIQGECNIQWSKSYIYFLIAYFTLCFKYPKFKLVTLSLHKLKSSFKTIKLIIEKESDFWKEEIE